MENQIQMNQEEVDDLGWSGALALVIGFTLLVCIMGISYVVRNFIDAYWSMKERFSEKK